MQLAAAAAGLKAAAATVVVHPRAAAFAFAGIQIQIHATDNGTALFQLEIAHIGVPYRRFFLHQIHAVELGNQRKQAVQYAVGGEVFFHFGFAKGVFGLTQLFAGPGQIPSLDFRQPQGCGGKGGHFGQIPLRKRLGAGGQIAQKGQYLLGGVGHFGGQRQFGIVGKAQQFGLALGNLQAAADIGAVVPLRCTQFAGAGIVGVVKLFAQGAVVGILHDRQIVRHLQADFIAAFAFGLSRGGKHGQRVFRQPGFGAIGFKIGGGARGRRGYFNPGQGVAVGKIQGEGIGGIEHVLAELRAQLRRFALQGGKFGLCGGIQLGTAQDKVAQIVVELGLLRGG